MKTKRYLRMQTLALALLIAFSTITVIPQQIRAEEAVPSLTEETQSIVEGGGSLETVSIPEEGRSPLSHQKLR